MRTFVLGFIVALAVVFFGAWIYFGFGVAPVATAASPMPLESWFAQMALHADVNRNANVQPPIPANESNYAAGAHVYRENCALCHGLPGQPQTNIAKGEFPRPPQLFKGQGVTDDPPGETYWKVANGIRLSGMPGFQNSLTTDQMWQVSLLLANANKLPAAVQNELQQPLAVK